MSRNRAPRQPSTIKPAGGDREQAFASYQLRHPGRDPLHDALAGTIVAVRPLVHEWIDDVVVESASRIVAGRKAAPWPALPTWARLTLMLQAELLKQRPSATLQRRGFLEDHNVLAELAADPPAPLLRRLLEGGGALAGSLRSGESLESVIASLREAVAELAPGHSAGEVAALMAADGHADRQLLELARTLTTGLAGAHEKKPPVRPKEHVLRGFVQGIRAYYQAMGLGDATCVDVADLAVVVGLEPEAYATIKERWRKRVQLF